MNAFEYLKSFNHLPMLLDGNKPKKATNSDIRRWIESKSIQINGVTITKETDIVFPVTSLVFFPRSKNKVTML